MLLVWDENAWQDYLWWQAQDRSGTEAMSTCFSLISNATATRESGRPGSAQAQRRRLLVPAHH